MDKTKRKEHTSPTMKRKFRFCYIGQNDNDEHWGKLTNIDILKSQIGRYKPTGSANRVMTSGVSRADLLDRVREYVRNYPGGHDAELTMNGTIETVRGPV